MLLLRGEADLMPGAEDQRPGFFKAVLGDQAAQGGVEQARRGTEQVFQAAFELFTRHAPPQGVGLVISLDFLQAAPGDLLPQVRG